MTCNGGTGADGHEVLMLIDDVIGDACGPDDDASDLCLRSGLDDGAGGGTADDGVLQTGEIDATSVLCDGDGGAVGDTVLFASDDDDGEACDANGEGGSRLRTGTDDGGDGGTADNRTLQEGRSMALRSSATRASPWRRAAVRAARTCGPCGHSWVCASLRCEALAVVAP